MDQKTTAATDECQTTDGTCENTAGCCGGQHLDQITRNQGGQFIEEGGMMMARNLEEAALDGQGDAQIADADYSAINALQVNMERSGADYIHAQKSFLTNSGAREISSESAKLTQSGVLTLKADTAEFKQSSAVIANTDAFSLHESRIMIGNANKVEMHSGSSVGMLNANDVDAAGDIRAFAIFGNNLKAEGSIQSTMSPAAAGAFGGAFAIALFLLTKLFGKKS